ncbi:MAG: RagB/SusD family nutrient uptake outer membrane protein [Paludibacter sp.]
MKKAIYLIFITLILISVSACDDLLNEKIYSQITNESITLTPAGMASAVVAMYEKDREIFRNNSDGESTLWTNMLIGDDVSDVRSGTGIPQFGRYTMLPSTPNVALLWQQEYAMIGYANFVITAVEKTDLTNLAGVQALAEAKVFRAHAYFWLIRKYDRIFLTTRVITPQNVNDSVKYSPAVPDSVFKLINSDLDYAIAHLSWTTTQPGRFSQGAARHIKAKVAAWEASYKYNGSYIGDPQKNWQEVANQVNAIDKSGKYFLMNNAADVFNGADLNNSEAILTSQWSRGIGGWYVNNNVNPPTNSGHRMPLHFMPLYNQTRGMVIDFPSGNYPWGRIFPNNYLLGLYDKTKDTRYKSFYKLNWTYNDPLNLPAGKKIGDTIFVTTDAAQYLNLHPACTKFNDVWTRIVSPTPDFSCKDIIIYRLPETYLMGAEAYLHLGKADSTAYYYNKSWVRAGNTAVTTVTQDMITDEHARELAFEGDRWFYLKRNGILIDRVKKHGGEFVKKGTTVVRVDTTIRTNIKDIHVRWPIPQSQIDQMGSASFPQNPGY